MTLVDLFHHNSLDKTCNTQSKVMNTREQLENLHVSKVLFSRYRNKKLVFKQQSKTGSCNTNFHGYGGTREKGNLINA